MISKIKKMMKIEEANIRFARRRCGEKRGFKKRRFKKKDLKVKRVCRILPALIKIRNSLQNVYRSRTNQEANE
jgi:hypothetical protein